MWTLGLKGFEDLGSLFDEGMLLLNWVTNSESQRFFLMPSCMLMNKVANAIFHAIGVLFVG